MLGSLPTFALAVVLISASPGPAMALIVRRASLRGFGSAAATIAGLEAGIYVWALCAAAGFAALVHALVPAFCTSTASRLVRHLGQLIEHRDQIDAIESEAVEARAFVLLIFLAGALVAPLWLMAAPMGLRIVYTALAFALPATLMISNPELMTREETAA